MRRRIWAPGSFLQQLFLIVGLFWSSSARAQHSMPVPNCPGRGLVAPGETGLWHLDAGYGCEVATDDLTSESAHLLPLWLHGNEAITAEYIYTGEVMSLMHGGFNTNNGTQYRGNMDLVLLGDTGAMDLWEGGRFFLYGNSYHGRSLTTPNIGDVQLFSNIDSTPRSENEFLLMEYWYEHSLADGDLIFKIGKQDANADFCYTDLGGDFLNSSFGFSPTVLLVSWPNTSMGITGIANLTDLVQYKAAVFDGAPSLGRLTGGLSGFTTLGDQGALTLHEVAFLPQLGANGDLPGTYKVGAWYHTHSFANLATGVGTVRGNYGFWTSADQMVWKESDSDEEPQGLGIFAQYGWSPSDRNLVDNYFGVGATYRGLIPERDLDLTGIGLATAWLSTPGTDSERAFEIFYKTQINNWASLQPDFTYIANPGGAGKDATVIGLRTEIVF